MNYKIRFAKPTDIDEIVNLCAEHADYEKAAYSRKGKVEKLGAFLFEKSTNIFCLMAENENGVIGYATCMLEFSTWDASYYMHMDCLFIRPEARGFGVGEALVKEIARLAIQKQCNLIQWQTPSFNERAIKFYYRIGATSKDKLRMYLTEEKFIQLIDKDNA